MLQVSLLTLQNVGTLLIYIAIGYLLRRSGKLQESASKVLSSLTANLLLPMYLANSLSQNFTVENISNNLSLLLCGLAFVAATILAGILFSRLPVKNDFERKSLQYAFTFSNYSYFGYPLLESVFGAALRASAVVLAIPSSIACYTYGYLLFSPKEKLSLKKILQTPAVIGIAAGIFLGLTGIQLPGFCVRVLSGIGSCMSPVSMVLAGVVLGSFPLRKLLTGARAYLYSAIRLIAIPAFFTGLLYICGARGLYLMIPALFSCLPMGMNLVVFPESYGVDASDNARMCFISFLMAAAILPFTFSLITALAGL